MKTNIMGTAVATVQQMQSYIQKVNPAVPKSVIDMVEYYISEGKTEGVMSLGSGEWFIGIPTGQGKRNRLQNEDFLRSEKRRCGNTNKC